MKLDVRADGDEVAAAAAQLMAEAALRSEHIALSGGSTPKKAYALVGDDARGATLWLGDERYVPADDEDSNYAMATEHLPAVEQVRTDLGLDAAAADYEQRLRAALGDEACLDLVLLGLGPDGHTASIFPGKPAVEEAERLVVGVPEAGLKPFVPRITMTLPMINRARAVVWLVAGEDKADAVQRAFGPSPDMSLPAAHVTPKDGSMVLLCDEAAAGRLAR